MTHVCACCRQPNARTCIVIDAAVCLTVWLCRGDRHRLQKRKSVRRWMAWGWWKRVTG